MVSLRSHVRREPQLHRNGARHPVSQEKFGFRAEPAGARVTDRGDTPPAEVAAEAVDAGKALEAPVAANPVQHITQRPARATDAPLPSPALA